MTWVRISQWGQNKLRPVGSTKLGKLVKVMVEAAKRDNEWATRVKVSGLANPERVEEWDVKSGEG